MKTESRIPVLVLSGVKGDTRRYRALHLVEQLRLCGLEAEFVHLTDMKFQQTILQPWKMIFFHRVPYRQYIIPLIDQLQQRGTLLISDFDDLIFDPSVFQFINSPDFADPVRAQMYKETMQRIRAMLDRTAGVMASTDYLAEQIRRLDKPAWVHRNAFSLKMLEIANQVRAAVPAERGPAPLVIGYASGTPTHNRDFELVRPALKQVMARYPQVELHLLGPLDPGEDWGDLRQRISRFKLVPWRRLPYLLSSFDINLAPLVVDNPFAQSKSEIKYMEAGMLGIPTVASPTDAFCYAIRSGQNGFLAASEAEWVEHLSHLIENQVVRKQVGAAALEAVMQEYHPETRSRQLAELLDVMVGQLQGGSFWQAAVPGADAIRSRSQQAAQQGGWAPEKYEKGPSYVQMGLFSLRTMGIASTAKYVWIFLRRLLSPIIPFKNKP
jgi:O-antigen biosynthesis protein